MTPSTSEGMKGGRPRTAITATMGAREELCSGREKEGRRLGWVEEGVGGGLPRPRISGENGRNERIDGRPALVCLLVLAVGGKGMEEPLL